MITKKRKPPVHIVLASFPHALWAIAEYTGECAERHGGMHGGRLRPEGCPPDEWQGSGARHMLQTYMGLDDEPHLVAHAFNVLGELEARLKEKA